MSTTAPINASAVPGCRSLAPSTRRLARVTATFSFAILWPSMTSIARLQGAATAGALGHAQAL